MPYARARRAPTMHRFAYVDEYVGDLGAVLDMDSLRGSTLAIGVDPLGGASVGYWAPIADRYGVKLDVVNDAVDPTFRFMTVDWDGKIRMDPSSPHAMAGLIGLRERYDLAFANDPDADRHGIVTRSAGLLNPNHYLAASIWYLFRHRPGWRPDARGGEDHREQQHDRPRGRATRPAAGRGAGRLQVLRERAPRRLARLRRRGERGRLVPPPRRHGVGHRQGRPPAWGCSRRR